MSSWDAPKRRLTIWGGSGLCASLFAALASANATVVLTRPDDAGFLAAFGVVAWSGALLAGPIVLARRIRIGLGACGTFCGALATLGALDAYLWLCLA